MRSGPALFRCCWKECKESFQVTLSLAFLYYTLGPASIPGIIALLLFFPINFFASHAMKRWQSEQMRLKDQRLKFCNEIFCGIKVGQVSCENENRSSNSMHGKSHCLNMSKTFEQKSWSCWRRQATWKIYWSCWTLAALYSWEHFSRQEKAV